MGKASKNLFDDDDANTGVDDGGLSLGINAEYAARLEHNKQREEWHRLKEKNPRLAATIEAKAAGGVVESGTDKSEDSSDDEDEDEDEDELAEQAGIDKRFLDVLSKIRQKDQSIYDSTAQFYPESESDPEGDNGTQGRPQPSGKARLKDVLAKQALDGHEGSSSDDEDVAAHHSQGPTYVQEQQQLRQAFLQEVEKAESVEGKEQESFGGVLKRRQRAADAGEEGKGVDADPESTQTLLDAYFGSDEAQLGEDDRFLKRFIASKGWLEKEETGYQGYGPEDEEDEQHIERAERFESEYNHRFEEPGGSNIVTYPRNLTGAVRKKDERRKATREAYAQRKAAEATAEQEQVKRLKSAKRREIDDRLSRIREASGSEVAERLLKEIMGTADFDTEEYDKAMAAAFDDTYYEGEDPDLEGEDIDEDADAAPALESLPEVDDMEEEEDALAEDVDVGAERAELTHLADEYSKMDAEDVVGGVRTRFRYREVPAADYGLNILDILRAPEKELNQVVGMKRLAPYREDAGRFRPNMAKLREMQSAAELPSKKSGKKLPHQRQSFEREQHRSKAPRQPEASDSLAAPVETAVAKQKQPGVKKSSKAATTTATAVGAGAQQERDRAKIASKPLKKQKTVASEDIAPLEVSGAADEVPVKHQKRKRPEQDSKGVHEQSAEEKAQSRLASFAKPTLASPSSTSQTRKKRKPQAGEPEPAPEQPAGPKLTKAQKKNIWRAKRRAMQHKEQNATHASQD